MNKQFVRAAAAAVAVAALWAGPIACPVDAFAGNPVTATAGVNVRSGPGLDQAIIGSLAQGSTVEATGPSSNGWTPVTWNGRAAWISSAYLSGSGASAPAATRGSAGTRATTTYLNVRSGPATSYGVLRVLPPQTAVSLTGEQSGEFVRLVDGGWVSSSYLTNPVAAAPITTGGTATAMTTTDAVNFRSGPSLDDAVIRVLAAGTGVQATGKASNGFSEVTVGSSTGWIYTTYLAGSGAAPAPAPAAPAPTQPAPVVTTLTAVGTKYTTDTLNIRTAPGTDNTPIAYVPAGTALQVTGITSGEWTQILRDGVARWVATAYLTDAKPSPTTTAPSVGLAGLTPSASAALAAIKANFPQLTTIYGVRPDGVGADHTEGRAVDFMISNYWNNVALGDAVAQYLIDHAAELNVHYVIWRQRIWLADAPQNGWTWMADRGSDTQNHYDHVHLSTWS